MKFFVLLILQLIRISLSTKILHVLPDNLPNESCPLQPCATLSQYMLKNGTLSIASNVEYHLLPGEHHVPINIMLKCLHNFSLTGSVGDMHSMLVLVDNIQINMKISESYNVTIANVLFKRESSYSTQNMRFYSSATNLLLSDCYYCKIENVTFLTLGLIGNNLIGVSHLSNIVVYLSTVVTSHVNICRKGIVLRYQNEPQRKEVRDCILLLTNISIHHNSNTMTACHNLDAIFSAGITLLLNQTAFDVTVVISNSQLHDIGQTLLLIEDNCNPASNSVWIKNCTFQLNLYLNSHIFRMLIVFDLSQFNMTLSFTDCKFYNFIGSDLISVVMPYRRWCELPNQCDFPTNITFKNCMFINNFGSLLRVTSDTSLLCRVNMYITGPFYIYSSINKKASSNYIIYTNNIAVFINGPLNVSNCRAKIIFRMYFCQVYFNGLITLSSNSMCFHAMEFYYCEILFSKEIVFESNKCITIIKLESNQEFAYVSLMAYSSIKFTNNSYKNLIAILEDNKTPYPPCLFQYVAFTNQSTILPEHYSIAVKDDFSSSCVVYFLHYTSHCKWLNSSVFYGYNPKAINQQIIQIDNKELNQHTTICHCSNCSNDFLGPVYPGQTLYVQLCVPCSGYTAILYAETHNVQLPNSACKIAHQTQLISVITNYSKMVNFTIVSEASHECKLLLTVSPYLYDIYEAFSVQLSPCPIGFTLKNGKCDCDPNLPTDIDTCYIDQSSVRRPANTWITAQQQSNNTKYLISDCPMDYCLPYSSNVNLLYPDAQCQFNRTGILCSQCKHPLSMVFGSPRCIECTNLHILIAIIVIVVGIILVILLYLLNLTVTNGAINGIIFYANIVSINDSVFLVNDGIFKPLRVFISFVNLDLGIETCFYNGMDSYAKMWLQLFFPTYLIIIAVIIIIASRYSLRLLRLTYSRSLSVLTTLFLLSYTGVLRTSLRVLFSYSSITHLPGGHKQLVWSIDASVSLFGFKFTVLFTSCLLLFLILILFNIILLFTRYMAQFSIINCLKPLVSTLQGSFKDKYHYWIALHIILKNFILALYEFQAKPRQILVTMSLLFFTIYHGYSQPYKNKIINIQELLLLVNLTVLFSVSYNSRGSIFSIIASLMLSLAVFHFFVIVLYHFFTQTFHFDLKTVFKAIKKIK